MISSMILIFSLAHLPISQDAKPVYTPLFQKNPMRRKKHWAGLKYPKDSISNFLLQSLTLLTPLHLPLIIKIAFLSLKLFAYTPELWIFAAT